MNIQLKDSKSFEVGNFLLSKRWGSLYKITKILLNKEKLNSIIGGLKLGSGFISKNEWELYKLEFVETKFICNIISFDTNEYNNSDKILNIKNVFYENMSFEYLNEVELLEWVNSLKMNICDAMMKK